MKWIISTLLEPVMSIFPFQINIISPKKRPECALKQLQFPFFQAPRAHAQLAESAARELIFPRKCLIALPGLWCLLASLVLRLFARILWPTTHFLYLYIYIYIFIYWSLWNGRKLDWYKMVKPSNRPKRRYKKVRKSKNLTVLSNNRALKSSDV